MEMEEFSDDPMLRKLLNTIPLESPSDGFTSRVMAAVEAHAVTPSEATPSLLQRLRSALPWVGLAAMIIVFICTSDLPLSRYLTGNISLLGSISPYFDSLVGSMANLFASSYVTFALGIVFSAGLLISIDHLFSRRATAGNLS